ncbi:MAG: hypothetical protein ACRDMZ_20470, partial [Solirubrobacteraceae bacterium]
PPTGVSPYGAAKPGEGGEMVLSELGDDEIRRPDGHPDDARAKRAAAAAEAKEEVLAVSTAESEDSVLSAEVQHIRRQRLTVTNRLNQVAKVFIRHTLNKGWTLLDAPPAFERVGDAHLFEVQLRPNEVKEVMIAEATPIERTLDLSADVTLEMMKVWIEAPEGTPELKDQLRKLLGIHKSLVDLAQEQDSLRRRLADYKSRMDDLHGQIVTLQVVKTGGELMGHLKTKMKEISDRVQKTTIQIVDQEEKIMLARVRFQDALGELALPDAAQATAAVVRQPAPALATPQVKH